MEKRGVFSVVPTALAVIMVAVFLSGPAMAEEEFSRLNKWEVFLSGGYRGDDTVKPYKYAYVDLKTRGTMEFETEPSYFGSIGLGRTIHDYLNLNGAFSYSPMKMLLHGSEPNSFVLVPGSQYAGEIKATHHAYTLNINADGYLFKNNFPMTRLKITPMITAGFGATYFHGHWSGTGLKIRDLVLDTTVGAGFRWDFSRFFVKALYTSTWFRLTDNEESTQLMGYNATFGCTF